MQLLALQQPMARDLRVIGASLRIVVDLERIGDHAVDIAKVVRSLAGQSFSKPMVDIPRLGELSRKMVGDSLQAFVNHDLNLAVQVARDDDAVDDLCDDVQNRLLDKMRQDPTVIEQATRLLLVARTLERVADHATNIVEYIYYIESGEMRQLAREEHGHNSSGTPSIGLELNGAGAERHGEIDHDNREILGSTDVSALPPTQEVEAVGLDGANHTNGHNSA
jgi:phosphate transport system protein